jgi:ribosomal protein L10
MALSLKQKVIIMSFIKNQFFEKKITESFQVYPYVLIFHYNNITSKEWLYLKKTLFQINPSIQNKVIPNRFLFQLWQNFKFENISQSDAHYVGTKSVDSFPSTFSESIGEKIEQNNDYNLGSSCLFFCSTKDDLKKIIEITESFGTSGLIHQSKTLVWSSTINDKKSNTLKFLNIGMIDIHSNQSFKDELKANFYNPYDIAKFLELKTDIFFQLTGLLNNNNNNLAIHLDKLLNFSNNESIPRCVFNLHHYDLMNILNFRSSQIITK